MGGAQRLRGIDRDGLAAEGSLEDFELIEGETGDATEGLVDDFAVFPEGGAQDGAWIFAVGLDFEVHGASIPYGDEIATKYYK